jgi:hypothetical protein
MKKETETVYVDALSKIQFHAGNFKLSFVELEDEGEGKINEKTVVKFVMSLDSTANMINKLAEFINNKVKSQKDKKEDQAN